MIKSRSWSVVSIRPNFRHTTVAYFNHRSDAEKYRRCVEEFLPHIRLEIIFDITADPLYWEQQFQNNDIIWDLGQPAPAFRNLLSSLQKPLPGRACVLGCGRGYDALLFAAHGFDVVGVDFAPSAIACAKYLAQTSSYPVEFLLRDIFDLDQEFPHYFDYVIEHMCFNSISPDRRHQYVQLVRSILKPQGELIGIFSTGKQVGGPPFGATLTEIYDCFEKDFEELSFQPLSKKESLRPGQEYLARFRRF